MAVVVPISADFDGSGLRAAQNAFVSFGSALSKTMQQAAKSARSSFSDVEGAAKTGGTAAQRFAAQLGQAADRLDAELKQTKTAADALGKALGPEFVAKAGGIDRVLAQLSRAGLTLDDVAANADELAAALRRVEDVQLSNVTEQTTSVAAKIGETAKGAEAARGAMSSFAGQATTELANVGGSLGAVASGLGQVVVQGVAGRAALADLAAVAGPMAALALVLVSVKSVVQDIKEAKAFDKDNVNAYRDALMETLSVSTAVRDRIDQVGGAFVQVQKSRERFSPGWFFHLPAGHEVVDITAKLVALGLTSKELGKIVAGGKPAVDRFVDGLKAQGVASKTVSQVSQYLNQELEATTEALKLAQAATALGVGQTDALASSMTGVGAAAGLAAAAVEAKAAADAAALDKTNALAEANRQAGAAMDSARDAYYRTIDASFALKAAKETAAKAFDDYAAAAEKAAKSNKPADIEAAAKAQHAAEQAALRVSAATADLSEKTSEATRDTDKAREATLAGANALDTLARSLDPASPLRRNLSGYVADLARLAGLGTITVPNLPTSTPSPSTRPPTVTTSAAPTGPTVIVNVQSLGDARQTARHVEQVIRRNGARLGQQDG